MRLVYYAHHHGSGHLRHAQRLQRLGVAEVVSVGAPGSDIELPPDVARDTPHVEPADSPFHWSPTTAGVRRRMAALHQVLADVDPDVVLVDVSVEAAVFSHLAGWPVAHRRMPGRRVDPPHQLGYAASRALFAYYPRSVEEPGFDWAHKTHWLGMPVEGPRLPDALVEPGTIVVLTGAGGDGVPLGSLVRAARQAPGQQWHVLGKVGGKSAKAGAPPSNLHLHGWVHDPSPWLARAELVVCGAGHNTIAAVASAHRACVIVPEARPHAEQVEFATSLHRVTGTPISTSWDAADWPELLARPRDPHLLAEALLVGPETFRRNVEELLEALRHPGGAGPLNGRG